MYWPHQFSHVILSELTLSRPSAYFTSTSTQILHWKKTPNWETEIWLRKHFDPDYIYLTSQPDQFTSHNLRCKQAPPQPPWKQVWVVKSCANKNNHFLKEAGDTQIRETYIFMYVQWQILFLCIILLCFIQFYSLFCACRKR